MNTDPLHAVYAAIGEERIGQMVDAFYKAVRDDDVLSPMYPADDMEGAAERLRDFLVMRCGGSPRYLQYRGHPALRMRHSPFPIDQTARDRWVAHMTAALDSLDIEEHPKQVLQEFLENTATFLINRRPP